MIGRRRKGVILLYLLFGIPILILVFISAAALLLYLTFESHYVPDLVALAGAAVCVVSSAGITHLIVRWIVTRPSEPGS